MARASKLKVYRMAIGFHDALVAAPSQRAALRAWGTTTDLFGAGRATIVDDPVQQAAALARPGQVIKRSLGGDPDRPIADTEAEDRAERAKPAKSARRHRGRERPETGQTDPGRPVGVGGAERALSEARAALSAQLDGIAAEREALDRREKSIHEESDRRITAARAARDHGRDEYDCAVRKSR